METLNKAFKDSEWNRSYEDLDESIKDKLLVGVDMDAKLDDVKDTLINNYLFLAIEAKRDLETIGSVIKDTQPSEMYKSMKLFLLKEIK